MLLSEWFCDFEYILLFAKGYNTCQAILLLVVPLYLYMCVSKLFLVNLFILFIMMENKLNWMNRECHCLQLNSFVCHTNKWQSVLNEEKYNIKIDHWILTYLHSYYCTSRSIFFLTIYTFASLQATVIINCKNYTKLKKKKHIWNSLNIILPVHFEPDINICW